MKEIKLTPSALFLMTLFLGFLLSWSFPWHLTSYMNDTVVRWTGVMVLIVSFIVNILAYREFKKSATPHAPFMKPKVLIQNGVFSLSRNPVYLALLFSQLGLAFVFDSMWLFVSTLMLLIMLDIFIVRSEEKILESIFHQEFENYKNETRRWF